MKTKNSILVISGHVISLMIILLLFTSCSETGDKLIKENFDFASEQLSFAITQTENSAIYPCSINSEGALMTVRSADWRSGFFPGELWYMYEYTEDKLWEERARKFTDPLEKEKNKTNTHDLGFMIYNSFGHGYRLTNDPSYREIMIETANTLIKRYNPNVGAIRSWDFNRDKWDFPVIIDNMMNLELLFWATKETGDSTYYNIAVNHAITTLKNHFRENSSSFHVVDYNPQTGEVRDTYTHQGFSRESSWSRGQAWGLYGYTMCYRETGNPQFLNQAELIASFILNHPNLPEDLIPYWDFDASGIPNEPRDASAAAVIASALYELQGYINDNPAKKKEYISTADNIIKTLSSPAYRSPLNENYGFLLLHSTGAKPFNLEIDVPLVYADYYFLEALLRKKNLDN